MKKPDIFDAETHTLLTRHSDLWFDDGSVICRAENTIFRVHRSQLSRHSLCFRDMFSIGTFSEPATSASLVTEDGDIYDPYIPVIVLYDAAEDVGNLFTALYDGPTFGNNDQDDFRIVSGILRLATKYLVDTLRERAIAHLNNVWPLTLKDWDAREDNARVFEMENTKRLYPSPIAVINLARETNAPALLPSAFYDLSRYTYAQIFEPEDDGLSQPSSSSSTTLALDASDLQRLSLGKESAQQAIISLIQSIGNSQCARNSPQHQVAAFSLSHPLSFSPSVPNPGFPSSMSHSRRRSSSNHVCTSAAECRKDFTELQDLATQHYLFDRSRGCYDPLYVAEELGQLKSDLSECKACARSLEIWASKERERIWKMVPMWFRLGHHPLPSPSRMNSPGPSGSGATSPTVFDPDSQDY